MWPAAMIAVTSPEAASMAKTVLRAAAQVTYNLLPSGLSTRPLASAGMLIERVTLPLGMSTEAICLASALATYRVLPSFDAVRA